MSWSLIMSVTNKQLHDRRYCQTLVSNGWSPAAIATRGFAGAQTPPSGEMLKVQMKRLLHTPCYTCSCSALFVYCIHYVVFTCEHSRPSSSCQKKPFVSVCQAKPSRILVNVIKNDGSTKYHYTPITRPLSWFSPDPLWKKGSLICTLVNI